MSSAVAGVVRPVPIPDSKVLRRDPAAQAFLLLRLALTVAPILFGLDKFAEVLTDDWTRYLAPQFNDILPGSAQDAMSSSAASRSSPASSSSSPRGSADCSSPGGWPASSSACCSSAVTATSRYATSA
jgi:hypothetical protein